MKLKAIKGNDLPQSDRIKIEKIWAKAFGWEDVDENETITYEDEHELFILYSEQENILAVASLKSLSIEFENNFYSVKGIGDVVAAIPGNGYGKTISKAVSSHVKETDSIGLGFCKRHISAFYEKCDYGIGYDLGKKFSFSDSDSNEFGHPDGAEDIIFVNDKNGIIEQISKLPNGSVRAPFDW